MKKILSLAGLALAAASLAPTVAMADDGISYNAGVVTDYRYRGISQTRLKPAVQGGVDYAKGAFYVGAWASTIKWIKDGGGSSNFELDLYGGYKGEISKDLSYDVGFLRYQYLKNELATNANTNEIYGALTYGPATVKYSWATTNLFGAFPDSKNSGYLEASAGYEIAGLTVTPHLGYQYVAKHSANSYLDYSVTVGKEVIKGLTLSAALVGTDADKSLYSTSPALGSKNLGKTAVVLGAKYAF
jgi:uncharacterized protein (TIGR02001 family)